MRTAVHAIVVFCLVTVSSSRSPLAAAEEIESLMIGEQAPGFELPGVDVSGLNYHLAIADRDRFANLLDPQWEGPVPDTLLIASGGKSSTASRAKLSL